MTLLHQAVILALVFKFTVHSLVTLLLHIRNRKWYGEHDDLFGRIIVRVQTNYKIFPRAGLCHPINQVVSPYIKQED